MPRIGAEPIRREAFIKAAIAEIGTAGSLDVSVARIARRAGMSPALAHHYFGSKERMFLEAMRHILRVFGTETSAALAGAHGPRGRLEAIAAVSFAPRQFAPDTVAAWLVFYVRALSSADTARLLRIYAGRLRTNLRHEFRALLPAPAATEAAETVAALIDGLYLRHALAAAAPDPAACRALVGSEIARLIIGKETT